MSPIPISNTARRLLIKLANGKTVKQAAAECFIAEQSAKNALGEAYKTLRVANRIEAFMELGWLTPPPDPTRKEPRP